MRIGVCFRCITRDVKIRTKLNFIFIAVFIFSVVVIGFLMQAISVRILSDQIFLQLATVAQSRSNHLDTFLEEQKDKIKIAATHQEFSVQELRDIVSLNREFYEVFVLDSGGKVIVGSDESQVGMDKSSNDYFLGGREDAYIKDAYYSETTGKDSIAVSTPFHDGVLVARIETTLLNEIVLDRTGLGEAGEIYLVNGDGFMITPSRFIQDTFLTQEVDTVGSDHCFDRHSDVEHLGTFIYSDYRGVSVLGSHLYVEEMNWCLLAEIDEDIAFVAASQIFWAYFIVIVIFTVLYLILIRWVSGTLTRPIQKLTEVTQALASGDYSVRAEIQSKDEIGSLSESYNKMVDEIVESRSDLESKIEKRTGELNEKTENLETQQQAILNILEDVESEKERVAEERDKIDTILHSSGDGGVVVDKDLVITVFNQVAADICGCSVEEVIGKRYDEVLNFVFEKDGKTNDQFIKEAMSSGEIKEMDNHTFLIRVDGVKVPVADSAAPLKDDEGNVIGCVVVFRDVTKQREIENMKTDFMNVAAHDLRTPITAVKGFTQMIRNGDFGKPPVGEMGEAFQDIEEGADRMIGLVNDFLTASRFDQGRMRVRLEDTDLSTVFSRVERELEATMRGSVVKLSVNVSKGVPKVQADEQKLIQVLVNLIDNSIKHTEKGKIIVTAEVEKDKKGFVVIRVTDTGGGISKKHIPHLFERYYRVGDEEVASGRGGGIGLGLYIVNIIIERHGGEVWVESEVGKGTIMSFSLKVAE